MLLASAYSGHMNKHASLLAIAICQSTADVDHMVAALNFSLPDDGSVPDWVELIPAGNTVQGKDGRSWKKGDPNAIVEASVNNASATHGEIPFDWEHSTELRAPNGEKAPASGWIKELQARENGSIWGRIEWTSSGRNSISSKEYRFISPVFAYRKSDGSISHLTSAALTNNPNLQLMALNRVGSLKPGSIHQENEPMLAKAIRDALGLSETASENDAATAINSLKGDLETARNHAATPPLEKFVPRGDYDTAMNRAVAAEQSLASIKQATRDAEIETVIGQALKAGKITPSTVEYHKANCQREGGIEAFKQFASTAPVIADKSGLDGKKPDGNETAMNAEQKKIANMFGNSAEDLAKNREEN